MPRSSWRAIVGLVLVFLGTVLLLDRAGIVNLTGNLWSSALLFLGAVAFLSWWRSNPVEWWPLLPGMSMLGWSVASLLGALGLPGWLVILIGFAGTALPFLYVFSHIGPTEGWWALIPAGIVGSWGIAITLSELGLPEALFLLIAFSGSALTFVAVYLINRTENWWALIPGGVMFFVGMVASLGEVVGEDWMATIVLLGIALVFAAVFIANRRQWWALIPAAALAVIGLTQAPWRFLQIALWPILLIVGGGLLLWRGLKRTSGSH